MDTSGTPLRYVTVDRLGT